LGRIIETPKLSSSINAAVAIRRSGVYGCFISSMNMAALIGQIRSPRATPRRKKWSSFCSAAPVRTPTAISRMMIQ
jgi:hypothetical protein